MSLHPRKLFVNNIDSNVNESTIIQNFSNYGKCNCRIVADKHNSSKKIAFIEYYESYHASSALSGMNNQQFGSKRIHVTQAKMNEKDIEIERKREQERIRREEERRRREEEQRRREAERRRREEEQRRREAERIRREQERQEKISQIQAVQQNRTYSRTTISIQNVPESYTKNQVKEIFQKYSPIDIKLIPVKKNPKSKEKSKMRTVLIDFGIEQIQLKVIEEMKDYQIEGKKINPRKAFEASDSFVKNNEGLYQSQTKVVVENLPSNMSKKDIEKVFENYHPTKVTKKQRIVITFDTHELQVQAISGMDGKTVNGKTITVKVYYEPLYTIIEKKIFEGKINKSASIVSKEHQVKEGEAILLLRKFNYDKKELNKSIKENPEETIISSGLGIEVIEKKKVNQPMQMYQQVQPVQPIQMIQPISSIQPIQPIMPIQPIQPIQPVQMIQPINQMNQIKPIEEIECSICMDITTDYYTLTCGHKFCKTCWKDHIQGSMNRGNILDIHCMEVDCHCLVTKELIKFATPELIKRYNAFLLKEYVEMKNHIFCPNPSCKNIIILNQSIQVKTIRCRCNQRFCANCYGEYHVPATCEELNKWEQESTTIDEDLYFQLTVKKCFHCQCPSERISGCNHITCPRCHKEWCWMCGGDWSTHGSSTGGYYQCNIYNEGGGRWNLDNQAEKMKAHHDRYMHYYNGYLNNNQIARTLQDHKMQKQHEIDAKFGQKKRDKKTIEESFNTLFMAKTWLKNSYIHLYYQLENSESSRRLIALQSEVERKSEELSQLLFQSVDKFIVNYIQIKAIELKDVLRNSEFNSSEYSEDSSSSEESSEE